VTRIVRESVLASVETIGLTAIAIGFGRVWGYSVSLWGPVGLAGAVVVVGHVGRRLRNSNSVKPPRLRDVSLSRPYARFALIRERLKGADRPHRFETLVQPFLVELADERLRRRHGVDWRRNPEQAHALLGDELSALLRGNQVSSPDIETVDALVRRIEQL
jgi:hypothetical protein